MYKWLKQIQLQQQDEVFKGSCYVLLLALLSGSQFMYLVLYAFLSTVLPVVFKCCYILGLVLRAVIKATQCFSLLSVFFISLLVTVYTLGKYVMMMMMMMMIMMNVTCACKSIADAIWYAGTVVTALCIVTSGQSTARMTVRCTFVHVYNVLSKGHYVSN